jgi:CRISPR-associated protein Cas2
MRVRAMRVIVFFDLPILTKKERRQYTIFRKYLLELGFIMVQKSVYSKITLNRTGMETVLRSLRHNKPPSGNVQILTVSERQYQNIEYLVGESQKEVIDSADRFVVI